MICCLSRHYVYAPFVTAAFSNDIVKFGRAPEGYPSQPSRPKNCSDSGASKQESKEDWNGARNLGVVYHEDGRKVRVHGRIGTLSILASGAINKVQCL